MTMSSGLAMDQSLVMIHLKIDTLNIQTQLRIMLMLWLKVKLQTITVQPNLFITLKKATADLILAQLAKRL